MYRIAWKSKLTGSNGWGISLYTKEDVDKIVSALNKEEDAICYHWAEEVNEWSEKV